MNIIMADWETLSFPTGEKTTWYALTSGSGQITAVVRGIYLLCRCSGIWKTHATDSIYNGRNIRDVTHWFVLSMISIIRILILMKSRLEMKCTDWKLSVSSTSMNRTLNKTWRLAVEATCQSAGSPALKHTLLYCVFKVKGTVIYKMNIMLYWRRLETRDWHHKRLWTS